MHVSPIKFDVHEIFAVSTKLRCVTTMNTPKKASEAGDLPSRIVDDSSFFKYHWSLSDDQSPLKYTDVINYTRRLNHSPRNHNCVMCGRNDVTIPTQNKDVCKICDSIFW